MSQNIKKQCIHKIKQDKKSTYNKKKTNTQVTRNKKQDKTRQDITLHYITFT